MDVNNTYYSEYEEEQYWFLDPEASQQPQAVRNMESVSVLNLAQLAVVGITLNVITL